MTKCFPKNWLDLQHHIEHELEKWLPEDSGNALHEAMRYSTLNGGKRIRALLCLLSCKLICGEFKSALPAAAAIECVHAYSLIHDDLPCMDDDDLRRGKPTSHKVFGEAIAILSGDALQTLAFEILALGYQAEPSLSVGLIKKLSHSSGNKGMVLGQAIDMHHDHLSTEQDLENMHRKKTGALISASVLMGAQCGGVTSHSNQWARLSRFSELLGLAFQISDDVLDVTGTTQELGKTAGKDVLQDKLTYVTLLGIEGAKTRAEELLMSAQKCLEIWGNQADPLRELSEFVVRRTR